MAARRYIAILATVFALAAIAIGYPAFAASTTRGTLGLTASTSPIMVPAPPNDAAVTGPPEVFLTVNNVKMACFNIDSGIVYSVNATGIHIWNDPGGDPLYEINKNAWFDSGWIINKEGPYHCLSDVDYYGKIWVYGFRNHGDDDYGFVGLNYLDIHEFYS
jgi:hypothetical protein